MDYFIIAVTSFGVAVLTFFSGFGLGTLLMPAFVFLLHNVEWAIAATAVVHMINNFFKFALVGRHAKWGIVCKFGLPAAIMAVTGAWLLNFFSAIPPIYTYVIGSRAFEMTSLKLVIAILMIGFALIDVLPVTKNLAFDPKYLPLGGVLSGFFGGLSGHQGPLRSAFLIRAGLTKNEFIGTGIVCAIIVDLARLSVYGFTIIRSNFSAFRANGFEEIVYVGIAAALAGSLMGARLLHKVTMQSIHWTVAVMLMAVALAMGAGLL